MNPCFSGPNLIVHQIWQPIPIQSRLPRAHKSLSISRIINNSSILLCILTSIRCSNAKNKFFPLFYEIPVHFTEILAFCIVFDWFWLAFSGTAIQCWLKYTKQFNREYIVGCQGASKLGGSLVGIPPRV